jgi:heptosyltransferase I
MTRFLVVRLSSIGDIVHTLPAVAALGEAFPQAEVHWAVEPRYAGLLDGNPFVRRVIGIDTLGWRIRPASGATLEDVARTTLELRGVAYDVAIDFQGLVKSATIAWLSRSRERLGLAEYWLKEPLAGVFYTDRVAVRRDVHAIEESMALVERLTSTSGLPPVSSVGLYDPEGWKFPLPRTTEADSYVEHQLTALGAREFIVINPGGGWMAKRWPPENYAELVHRLESELPYHFLLTGSPEEQPMIEGILQRAKARQAACFRSTLVEFTALVRRASLFIGGDTGPLHLAAAVRTPIVAIYGPTEPARNGPFSPEDIALSNSGPFDHTRRTKNPAYLQGVSVEAVLEAVRRRVLRVQRAHG